MKQLFINELRCNFNLRQRKTNKPTNIYLVVRIDGKQYKFTTGVKVYPEQWNERKQEAFINCRLTELDYLNNCITNKKILEYKNIFSDFKSYICDNPNLEILPTLYKYIYKDMNKKETNPILWLRKTIRETDKEEGLTDSTISSHKTDINSFERFIKTRKEPFNFSDIKLSLMKMYESWLKEQTISKNGKRMKIDTVGIKVKNIILLFKKASAKEREKTDIVYFQENLLDGYREPKSLEDKDENGIYLTKDEIDKLTKFEIKENNEKKQKQKEEIRDLFVLLCWTGQRFSDLDKLIKGTIKEINGIKVVEEYVQDKKKSAVTIPLIKEALAIYEKYDYKLPQGYSRFNLNYHIKKIAKAAGINELHTIKDHRETFTARKVPKYELIASHTGRRTYATNMLLDGVRTELIMKITGHKTEASFKKYLKMSSEEAALKVAAIFEQRENNEQRDTVPKTSKVKPTITINKTSIGETITETTYSNGSCRTIKDSTNEKTVETSYPDGRIVIETDNYLDGFTTIYTVFPNGNKESIYKDNMIERTTFTNIETGITEEKLIDNSTGLTEIVKVDDKEKSYIALETRTGRELNRKVTPLE